MRFSVLPRRNLSEIERFGFVNYFNFRLVELIGLLGGYWFCSCRFDSWKLLLDESTTAGVKS